MKKYIENYLFCFLYILIYLSTCIHIFVAAVAKDKLELVDIAGRLPFRCSLELFCSHFHFHYCFIVISDLYAGSKE